MSRHNKAAALQKLCEDLAGKGLIDMLVVKASPIWVPADKGQAYNALVAQHLGVHGIQTWQGFLEDYRHFGGGSAGRWRRDHTCAQSQGVTI